MAVETHSDATVNSEAENENADNELEESIWKLMSQSGFVSDIKCQISKFIGENSNNEHLEQKSEISKRSNGRLLSSIFEYLKYVGLVNTCSMLLSETQVEIDTKYNSEGDPSFTPFLLQSPFKEVFSKSEENTVIENDEEKDIDTSISDTNSNKEKKKEIEAALNHTYDKPSSTINNKRKSTMNWNTSSSLTENSDVFKTPQGSFLISPKNNEEKESDWKNEIKKSLFAEEDEDKAKSEEISFSNKSDNENETSVSETEGNKKEGEDEVNSEKSIDKSKNSDNLKNKVESDSENEKKQKKKESPTNNNESEEKEEDKSGLDDQEVELGTDSFLSDLITIEDNTVDNSVDSESRGLSSCEHILDLK